MNAISGYEESKPLYGSRGVNNYLKFIKEKYPHINVNELLEYAQMEPYQVKDEGHLFSQKQLNLFHEKLVQLTGNTKIAREAGRFASTPEALGTMRRSLLGLIGPVRYYELIGKYANKISRASKYEAHRIGPNKVEILVTPHQGIVEQPYQCENRLGYWDAVSSLYNLKPPQIDHPECMFKGDDVCRYVVTWKQSSANILKRVRNFATLGLGILCLVLSFSLPIAEIIAIVAVSASIVLLINWWSNDLELKDLRNTVEELRGSADDLMEQVELNYENSLLINEIGQTLAKKSNFEELFSELINTFQKRLDYDRGLVMLANDDKTRLIYQTGYGYTDEQLVILKKISFHLDNPNSKGIFTVTFNSKKPFLLNDINEIKDDLSARSYEFARKMGVRSIICCPIIYENESLGILAVDNLKSKRPLLQRDINLLMGIAPQIGSRIHNMRLESHYRQSQKMEAVGNLAASVAHDFNNILTSILGYSQIVSMRLEGNDQLKSMVDDIHAAGNKAAALTRQLLAFSRREAAEMKVTNLNIIVEEMSKMIGRLIGENVTMETALSDSVRNIKADVGQVEQILLNLVVNAKDAMPEGGRLIIETGETYFDEHYTRKHQDVKVGHYAMLTVTDTGEGMPRDVRERIFEPFFTTKGVGHGTGLGLFTVYGIIKQHHGHIYVYSEPGRGTSFKIYFPVVSGDIKESQKESMTMPPGNETVVVVDDEDSVRRLVLDTLVPLGYEVLEASCGEDAYRVIERMQGNIDLLVTDAMMPGMNGIELIEKVKSKYPKIKGLLMSGYADKIIAEHKKPGSDFVFINKPLLPISLSNKIRSVLDGTYM